jgi:PST family polysaccharide transporter
VAFKNYSHGLYANIQYESDSLQKRRSNMNMTSQLLSFLPVSIRSLWKQSATANTVVGNTSWLIADKMVRMGIGLLVGVWLARYLGPEQFGILNYATAFFALFSAVATLGLDEIVVRDIVRATDPDNEILGTSFVLKFVGGFAAFALAVVAVLFIRPTDALTQTLVMVIAFGSVFQAFDVIDFWFQSQVQSKYVVYAKNAAFLLISLVKAVMIMTKASLVSFAWAGVAEIVVGSIGLVVVYRSNGYVLSAWRSSFRLAKKLLHASWPLIFSGIIVMIYIRIDQVMIGEMIGNGGVGVYSAAVRLTEVWYVFPTAICSSLFPLIVNAKKTDEALYYRHLQKLYVLMFWLSLVVAIFISIYAGRLVTFIFGKQYIGATMALSINCWAGIFIFSGLVSNLWYLIENLSHYALYRHLLGALVNVSLNLVLIPRYGINGAAIATLITQFVTSYLFDALNRRTRGLFIIKTRTFLLFLPITVKLAIEYRAADRK